MDGLKNNIQSDQEAAGTSVVRHQKKGSTIKAEDSNHNGNTSELRMKTAARLNTQTPASSVTKFQHNAYIHYHSPAHHPHDQQHRNQ